MKSLFTLAFTVMAFSCFAQQFSQRADFPGAGRFGAVRFVINDVIYVGLGEAGAGNYPKDFYKYNAATNQWSAIASFPGAGRETGVAYAVNGKGYVGLGVAFIGVNTTVYKDFWRYDPTTDSWTQLGDFDGLARSKATAFVLNGAAYVGTGVDEQFTLRSDWWKYDPATDNWVVQNNLGNLPPRYGAVAYIINNKAYLTGGAGASGVIYAEIHEFNSAAAASGWVLKTSDTANLSFVSAAVFVLDNKAYLCYGLNANFVTRYDPFTNQISNLGDLLGLEEPLRYAPIAYVTSGGKGYLGLGYASVAANQAQAYRKDFWQFNATLTATTEPSTQPFAQVIPNVGNGLFRVSFSSQAGPLSKPSLSVFNIQGAKIRSLVTVSDQQTIDMGDVPAGLYILQFQMDGAVWTQRIIKQ